jgi:LCP family protein required for cell wall assembly
MADEKKPGKPAKKPAAKKPAAKKPAAPKKQAPKKQAPKKQAPPKKPEDLEIEEDFLEDIDSEIDDIVTAPTEEHPAPTGAIELEDQEDEELEEEEPEEDEDAGDGDEQPTLVGGTAVGAGGSGNGKAIAEAFGRPRRRFPLWARFISGSLVIVAAVAVATASSLILFLSNFADDLAHGNVLKDLNGELSQVQGGAPETFLIIGSDRRKGAAGAGVKYGLSDTTILLRVDPDANAISLMSIPRDLEVSIPGYGVDKFNAAYSIGGPKLTLQTVKALTGLGENGLPGINHVVNVDFLGFVKAVDAINCVYVDVDRRYYHSNQGLSASAQYSEINIRPGYQRLCGYDALPYVRYRHTDNDIVRGARQQDFLREARARVPTSKLLPSLDGSSPLLDIFTQYTTSDIGRSPGIALQVLKLFISARNEPIKEVHFPGTVGAKVTVTPGEMEQAMSQFLGIEGTKGPRGTSAQPVNGASAPEAPPTVNPSKAAKAPAQAKQKAKASPDALGLEGGSFGRKLALRVHRKEDALPVYYPTTVLAGSEYAQAPRVYTLADPGLALDERTAYKFVLKTSSGDYYGLQGLKWKNAPILDEPHETKKFGDREYNLYYDNDRLRMISWETDDGVYWVSNSLLQSLSADQMLAIARGATLLTANPSKKKK